MTKIKTLEPVNYGSPNLDLATLLVTMPIWKECAGWNYFASIQYWARLQNGDEILIREKDVTISPEKYNELCAAVEPMIPEGLSYYEKRELRKKLSLLVYVKYDRIPTNPTKCIFGTDPEIWVIDND